MRLSITQFLETLKQLSLLSETDISQWAARYKDAGEQDAAELAQQLVAQGKLTKYQAAAIYQGKGQGLLLGNYLIADKLGAGGMGYVYKAKHRRLDRVVALKVLIKKLVDSPASVERFHREGKAAAKLSHPNIVGIYDADEATGLHFLVMEYVDGVSLSQQVRSQGPMEPARAIECVLQAARGLAHAHGQGIVHRDVKPSNLMLEPDGTVKVLDMGLARIGDVVGTPIDERQESTELTQSGQIMGTVDFMAPEQALDSRTADARSDIYGLGCTLYFLLAGKPPFNNDTVAKRLIAHQTVAAPQLSSLDPELPQQVETVYQKMMAKQPSARFQTMAEVVAAVQQCAALLIARGHPPALPKAARLPQAKPLAVAAVADSDSSFRASKNITLPAEAAQQQRKRRSRLAPLLVVAAVVALLAVGAVIVGPRLLDSGPPPLADAGQGDESVDAAAVDLAGAPPQPAPPPQPTLAASGEEDSPDNESPGASEQVASTQAADAASNPSPMLATPAGAATPADVAEPASDISAATTEGELPEGEADEQSVSVIAATGAALALVGEATASPAGDDDPRWPIPSDEEQQQAEKLVREIFADDYADLRGADERIALAEKLLAQIDETPDDAVGNYVMLREARNLAAAGSSPTLVERAVDTLHVRYRLDRLELLAESWAVMMESTQSKISRESIVAAALQNVDEAVSVERFDLADQLADTAVLAAQFTDSKLRIAANNRRRDLADQRQSWEQREAAQAVLESNPEDKEANLLLGRYYAFQQNDWPRGFAMLAKGGDAPLAALARESLERPADTRQSVALGDRWWQAAEEASGNERAELRHAAAYWYAAVRDQLSGLELVKVQQRLDQLPSELVATLPTFDLQMVAASDPHLQTGSPAIANPRTETAAPSPTATDDEPAAPIDVLALIDLRKHVVAGEWTAANGALVGGGEHGSRVQVPYSPPAEYDLHVAAQQLNDAKGALVVGLMTPAGKQFYFAIRDDAVGISAGGVANFDDVAGLRLPVRQPTPMIFSVRRDSITLTIAGQKIMEYHDDQDRLSVSQTYVMPVKNQLFIGAAAETRWAIGAMAVLPHTPAVVAANPDVSAPTPAPVPPPQPSPQPTPASLQTSGDVMLGRVVLAEQDLGMLVSYQPGKVFPQAAFEQQLTIAQRSLVNERKLKITLLGEVVLARTTDVWVWHAGGTNEFGIANLYIDNELQNSLGRLRAKNLAFKVTLQRGTHTVRWELSGGPIGDCLLQIIDAASREPVPIKTGRDVLVQVRASEPSRKVDISADGPKPPEPRELLAALAGRDDTVPMVANRRPAEAVGFNNHYYMVFYEKIRWSDAKRRCEEMGGHLACITLPQEDQFVVALVEQQLGRGKMGTETNKFWLGGYLEGGRWQWVTGEAMQYMRSQTDPNPNRPCLRHAGDTWLNMSDAPSLIAGYICEWDK